MSSAPSYIVAAALLLAGACHAEPPADNASGYSHAIALTVHKDSGLAAMRLPQQVYLSARSSGLDDLRVFDRNGATVPFALLAPQVQTKTTVTDLPVRIFPLMTAPNTAGDPSGSRLDIRTDAGGRLLSVASSSASPGHRTEQESLSGLILEISGEKEAGGVPPAVSALRFELPAGGQRHQRSGG